MREVLTEAAQDRQMCKMEAMQLAKVKDEERGMFESEALRRAHDLVDEVRSSDSSAALDALLRDAPTLVSALLAVVDCCLTSVACARAQYKQMAADALARAHAIRDEIALQQVEALQREEEDRRAFRDAVMKQTQQLVRACSAWSLCGWWG